MKATTLLFVFITIVHCIFEDSTHYLSNMTSIPTKASPDSPEQRPSAQFLLFGDSITQSSHQTLIPLLSTLYSRRLDIVNRGLSGYTSVAAAPLLPHIFPAHSTTKTPLMTVFFGANDACLPGNQQHVPVEQYASTIRKIIQYPLIAKGGTHVLLLTPPPIDEWQLDSNGGFGSSRRAAVTKVYADAARYLAVEAAGPDWTGPNVTLVDVWRLFMLEAGWSDDNATSGTSDEEYLPGDARREKSAALARLLSDGLHFTVEGYELLYREMERVIRTSVPDACPERLPMVFPEWQDVVGDPGWERGNNGEGRL
ncbi:GDSL esterase/lipase [Cyphellophora attinorum]|uniref:GDSL esterase/lipase n=1 Tax=Cyphellophora attinorum TaxID=1664694 RepID=A0A0N0NHW4_9EURO|nr:GDSL esterase/lipase [Phialophora attinorum]KPI35038.1 GDSL esterase/lipase [Phialophora attinorum]